MRVTQVGIRPSEASTNAGRPVLTPELLAATGARYSRNNDGLEAILSLIDPNNLEKSVDGIFKMIDYGHESIADMVPVAMFIDGISIWLAYHIWSISPTASGQESSTRYIKLSDEGLLHPSLLGIPVQRHEEWNALMRSSFDAYQKELHLWENILQTNPQMANIPEAILEDRSDRAQKQVARMRRNFAFDRSRYFLPVAAATNLMLLMSARQWVYLCQNLFSHPLPEAQFLGEKILRELELSAPRLVKHAERKTSRTAGILAELQHARVDASTIDRKYLEPGAIQHQHPENASFEVFKPARDFPISVASDLAFHENRYSWVGENLRRVGVRFSWEAVALAELRDLNRHRTGNKFSRLVPRGFYCAWEEIPTSDGKSREELLRLSDTGRHASMQALSFLENGDHTYVYWSLLGTQYAFEHTTTADKFIYEAELRTGVGAHFKYASHLRSMLDLWYRTFPETRGLVIEGSAEPE